MSKEIKLEPGDFHVAVRRREHAEVPWRWEIWAAGRTKSVAQSNVHYATMSQAAKEGKAALKAFRVRPDVDELVDEVETRLGYDCFQADVPDLF
jgi:hypothetical protein